VVVEDHYRWEQQHNQCSGMRILLRSIYQPHNYHRLERVQILEVNLSWQDFAALQQESSCHMTLKREVRPREVPSRALLMMLMQAAQSLILCCNERKVAVFGCGADASANWWYYNCLFRWNICRLRPLR